MTDWNAIRNSIRSGDREFVDAFREDVDQSEKRELEWIADLRARGFAAAHPDDGWVNRQKNEVELVYPQFDDGVSVGSKIMLGYHFEKGCPVRVTEMKNFMGLITYTFEEIEPAPVPIQQPKSDPNLIYMAIFTLLFITVTMFTAMFIG
jgi:hypothetical protein